MSNEDSTYRGRFSSKAIGLSILPVVVSIWLIQEGLYNNSVFGMSDVIRWPFVILPLGIGLATLVLLITAIVRNVNKRVVLSSRDVTYFAGKTEFSARWNSLAISLPKKKGVIRKLLLSNGTDVGELFDIFTPGFDELCKSLESRKNAATTGQAQTRFKM